MGLNVPSTLGQFWVDTASPLLARIEDAAVGAMVLIERAMQIRSAALAEQICIVRWRAYRDCLGRTVKEITHVMRESLQLVCFELDVVFQNDIVGRTSSTLKTLVSLQPEFAKDAIADVPIDNGAGEWVPRALFTLRVVIGVVA